MYCSSGQIQLVLASGIDDFGRSSWRCCFFSTPLILHHNPHSNHGVLISATEGMNIASNYIRCAVLTVVIQVASPKVRSPATPNILGSTSLRPEKL